MTTAFARTTRATLACCLSLVLPAMAQDAEGNDRPSNWEVTHQRAHGIWDSVCDQRDTGDAHQKRCYIRHVDVFSPRPKFAAQFLFVTNPAQGSGPEVEFGIEAGTLFAPGNFRLERGGETTWSTLRPGCLTGISCRFDDQAAQELLSQMRMGGVLAFDFRDRHGETRALRWSLDGFPKALADFNLQATKRNLPPLPDLP